MKKITLGLFALVLASFVATSVFSASSIVQSISYSAPMKGFIAIFKGDSSKVIEEKPKQYEAGKTYNGVALTVTGTNWTTSRAVFIPYRTADGAWRLKFNIYGAINTTTTSLSLVPSGVSFHTGAIQAVSFFHTNGDKTTTYAVANSSGFSLFFSSGAVSGGTLSGDVELASKPTWAD